MFAPKLERRDTMYTDGYLKLSRKILSWRWYKDSNTARLFLHLMLKANHTKSEFEAHSIKRGQLVTGRKALASELGLTERQVRTALEHLKMTNDIAIDSTSKYSIITMLNYEDFQTPTNKMSFESPTDDQQATNERPQYKNNNKNNKNNKYKKYLYRSDPEHAELLESKSMFND